MRPSTNKQSSLTFIIFSVGYILLGLLLLLAPEQSRRIICYLLGAGGVILGIIRIAWYFAKDELSRAFHNDIPTGVVLVIAGIYLIVRPDAVWDWLPVLLGLAVVFDSIIKLQQAFDLRRTGFGTWWIVLAVALATAVLGALLIVFGKNVILLYFGIVLIVDGLVNLGVIVLLALHNRKTKTPPDDTTASSIADAPPPAESN